MLNPGRSVAAPICKPELSFASVRFSEAEALHRTWSATVNIDASRCAAAQGTFQIHFLRLKENAVDLEFTEQFTWQTRSQQTGQIEVSLDVWIDESVGHYAIGQVASCPCRNS
jgi:hypothetical protein